MNRQTPKFSWARNYLRLIQVCQIFSAPATTLFLKNKICQRKNFPVRHLISGQCHKQIMDEVI